LPPQDLPIGDFLIPLVEVFAGLPVLVGLGLLLLEVFAPEEAEEVGILPGLVAVDILVEILVADDVENLLVVGKGLAAVVVVVAAEVPEVLDLALN
jgi:hypothetical protein